MHPTIKLADKAAPKDCIAFSQRTPAYHKIFNGPANTFNLKFEAQNTGMGNKLGNAKTG